MTKDELLDALEDEREQFLYATKELSEIAMLHFQVSKLKALKDPHDCRFTATLFTPANNTSANVTQNAPGCCPNMLMLWTQ